MEHLNHSICSTKFTIWSTPYVNINGPYGVLHMSININHMECLNKLLQAPHTSKNGDHMEHSICWYISTIWSTPYGNINWPYGVLHMSTWNDHMECLNKLLQALHTPAKSDHMEHSICWYKSTNWSTPYGNINWPYGVLHMAIMETKISRERSGLDVNRKLETSSLVPYVNAKQNLTKSC